jgi:hypothetical protein
MLASAGCRSLHFIAKALGLETRYPKLYAEMELWKAMLLSRSLSAFALCAFSVFPLMAQSGAGTAPKIVTVNGRHALMVDGAPYFVLGAQINNSSSWPAVLPQVWPALEAMHVNTAAAPVYWEQIEPRPGVWDWTSVDALIDGARAHHLHLVLLWFGTWKNGNDHYVPDWVKADPQKYPRVINAYGNPLDVLSANSDVNRDADRAAFVALTKHLAERDGSEHTIVMIQVENESGIVGSVRDFSAMANRQFGEQVPVELVKALGKKPGTWSEVFPGDADEAFQAWTQARYVNSIVEAGKRQFDVPMYCNVWLAYPPAELPERHIAIPGIGYPSGGPVQTMLPLWKVAAPALDAIGPDMYSDNPAFDASMLKIYSNATNPLWIPETGSSDGFAPLLFAAVADGGIGFSPFGVDWTGWTLHSGEVPKAHTEDYELLGPMDRTLAKLAYAGRVKAAIEAAGGVEQEIAFSADASAGDEVKPLSRVDLSNATVLPDAAGTPATRAADAAGDWVAEVRFGFPQRDGESAPGTEDHLGRILVAQTGPNEFLLTGLSGSVRFHRPGYLSGIRMQILSAEQGYYTPAETAGAPEVWHATRLLNGDEDDRGILFPAAVGKGGPMVVRIKVGRF